MTNREKINWLLVTLAGACGVVGAYLQGGWKTALPAAAAALASAAGINGYVAGKQTATPQSLMTQLATEIKALDQKKAQP